MIREPLLWVEKYRPKKVSDCILPENLRQIFQSFVDTNQIHNMTLAGKKGIGKTSISLALCDELDADVLFISASENGNIDTLRTDIRQFASTVSMTGGRKVVILDEADGLSRATQQGLRSFIEEFAHNCSFILTCNFPNQIIDAISESRCPVIEFKPGKEDKPIMAKKMHKRIEEVLKAENVPYDTKVIAQLVKKYFPDFRATLMHLQKYAASGKIDSGIFANIADVSTKELIEALKTKNFSETRKWVANNIDNEPQRTYRQLFDSCYDFLEPKSIPEFILILAEYLDQSSRSLDQEIVLLAFLIRIMASEEIGFK
jgi:DNA polymerase III delta prime subunit